MVLISIIIPSYNAHSTIFTVLDSIKRQKGVLFEVILMDDYPKKPLFGVNKYPFVKYFKNEVNLGLSKSINRGIKYAKGKYIMILHDDCVLIGTDWLKKMILGFDNPDAGAVIGEHVIKYDSLSNLNKVFSYVYGLGVDINDANKKGFEEVKHLGDKCDVFKKDYLIKLGSFDESFSSANEDTELSSRILLSKKKILLNHDAKVIHLFSETERQSSFMTHMKKAIQLNKQGVIAFLKTGSKYKLDMLFVWIMLGVGFFGFVPFLAVSLASFFVSPLLSVFSVIFAFLFNLSLGFGFSLIPIIYVFGKSSFKSMKALSKKEYNMIPFFVFIYSALWDLLAGLAWGYGIILYLFNFAKKVFR